jgi:hypothetical protein
MICGCKVTIRAVKEMEKINGEEDGTTLKRSQKAKVKTKKWFLNANYKMKVKPAMTVAILYPNF